MEFIEALPSFGKKARLIALYLPQYHPIPENDLWWGKGFTEWTNTTKAKPLFWGHYQPHIPADLGFYDLRVPETRAAQADMARHYGIEAFCYYHYWFAGERLLERPFEEVLASGQPDFPFCLCWANQTWSGIWHGAADKVLIEQTYPGMADHRRHFEYLLPAFLDKRYVCVDGKPVFVVYNPKELPDALQVTDFWRELAVQAGLPGLFLIAETRFSPCWDPKQAGFDASIDLHFPLGKQWLSWRQPWRKLTAVCRKKLSQWCGLPMVYAYQKVSEEFIAPPVNGIESYPCVIPNWDNTPRSGKRGIVLNNSTPEYFRRHLQAALQRVSRLPEERRFVFVKSWNEWAEGNHLEPDLRFGHGYLEVIKEELLADAGGEEEGRGSPAP